MADFKFWCYRNRLPAAIRGDFKGLPQPSLVSLCRNKPNQPDKHIFLYVQPPFSKNRIVFHFSVCPVHVCCNLCNQTSNQKILVLLCLSIDSDTTILIKQTYWHLSPQAFPANDNTFLYHTCNITPQDCA